MYKYIQMPDGLSGEQAFALMEFIWQLEQLVWETYEEKLRDLIGPDPPEPAEPATHSDQDLDDDIPF